jgi:hypothetical protein
MVDLPNLAALPVPPQLNPLCRTYFDQFSQVRTDIKAFAVNPQGHCGYNYSARSLDEAKQDALAHCSGSWKNCRLYAVGQELAAP